MSDIIHTYMGHGSVVLVLSEAVLAIVIEKKTRARLRAPVTFGDLITITS